ncbi:MAG: T9SS type A sorting domain-containing protein [Bacteroidia bacterium]
MKKLYSFLFIAMTSTVFAQTTIQNGNMELWDNAGAANEEPQFFNSNQTGTDYAPLGPQTCFRETVSPHGGTYCARIETKTFFGQVVNGSMVTGIVNAPTTNKSDGYIGTMKGTTTSDIRRMAFIGRPDSLVGYYKYTQGGSAEKGKVRAILHLGHYYDPEAGSSYHPDSSANKIGDALFLTPASNVSSWTRFAVAFNYVSAAAPQYIMINTTSSNDQLTTVSGSKLWLDDLSVVYNSSGVNELDNANDVDVYAFDKQIHINVQNGSFQNKLLLVYDLTGKLVASEKITNDNSAVVDVSKLNPGLYLYQLSGTDLLKTGKLFIK